MSRRSRLVVFLIGAAGVAVLLALGFLRLPAFGGRHHPYRDLAVAAAVAHRTANVVSSVNFDQRGIDTLGEETILLGSVVGAAALLRPARGEHHGRAPSESVLDATRLVGYLFLPVTVLLGLDLVAHGHLTPGGGFQGGVVAATGYHLLYVAGTYRSLDKARPVAAFDVIEAAGGAAFAGLGVAGIAVTGAFLANLIPQGSFGSLLSSGSVGVLNFAVGVEVACGTVVLLAKFLEQALVVRGGGGHA